MSVSGAAKPFIKWAGGKTQLINSVQSALPQELDNERFTYIEPFVGSGAVLFWMLERYPNMNRAVINDLNGDLMNVYRTIASNVTELVATLKTFQTEYYSFGDDKAKKHDYYYAKRDLFNSRQNDEILHAALFIFLNRTCFNGLYRVNRSNSFNVPMGEYKHPNICDEENLRKVSVALQKVEIMCGDFEMTVKNVDNPIFVYFDPPYKPISSTSNFNSYAKGGFDDEEQVRVKNFCVKLSNSGCKWMLSNSDVNTEESPNRFFDDLYAEFNIRRVKASRRINSKAANRGLLNELLITNY